MANKPDAWMPLYFGAYLADTMLLNTEQHGAYLLLLMACWKAGGRLPDDDTQLAAAVRLPAPAWKRMRPVIGQFWIIEGGYWTQKRVTKELTKARGMVEQRSEAGKASAEKRWGNGGGNGEGNETGNEPITGVATESIRENAPPTTYHLPPTGDLSPIPPRPRAERATRLPPTWTLPAEWEAWAIQERGWTPEQARAVADKFRDHWVPKAGQAGRKLDWLATWRNWVRDETRVRGGSSNQAAAAEAKRRIFGGEHGAG